VANSTTAVARFITSAILLGIPGPQTPAFARASSFEDKIWDAGNINGLPPEVRRALTRVCGPDLAAQQYLAGYYANSKFLVLHFGRLRCGNRLFAPREDACIRSTKNRVSTITC
jgi:hypothetical protein